MHTAEIHVHIYGDINFVLKSEQCKISKKRYGSCLTCQRKTKKSRKRRYQRTCAKEFDNFLRFNHQSCFEKLSRNYRDITAPLEKVTLACKRQLLHAVKKFRACTPEERCFVKLSLGDSQIISTDRATLIRAKKKDLRRILKENTQHLKRDSTVLQFEIEGDNYMSYQRRGHSISFIPFS